MFKKIFLFTFIPAALTVGTFTLAGGKNFRLSKTALENAGNAAILSQLCIDEIGTPAEVLASIKKLARLLDPKFYDVPRIIFVTGATSETTHLVTHGLLPLLEQLKVSANIIHRATQEAISKSPNAYAMWAQLSEARVFIIDGTDFNSAINPDMKTRVLNRVRDGLSTIFLFNDDPRRAVSAGAIMRENILFHEAPLRGMGQLRPVYISVD